MPAALVNSTPRRKKSCKRTIGLGSQRVRVPMREERVSRKERAVLKSKKPARNFRTGSHGQKLGLSMRSAATTATAVGAPAPASTVTAATAATAAVVTTAATTAAVVTPTATTVAASASASPITATVATVAASPAVAVAAARRRGGTRRCRIAAAR